MDFETSFENAVDDIVAFLPNLVGFLVLLIVGFVVAKVVSNLVGKLLTRMGVDRRMHESDAHRYVERILPGARVAKPVALLVFWVIFAFFVVAAISALDVRAVTAFMNELLAYLPNILVALVIFVVAAMIAGTLGPATTRSMGDTSAGRVTGTAVSGLVMVIAMFMILEQLQIAEEIVRIAFAAVMFALALGLALAFGLGGRDSAQRLLDEAYVKGQEERQHIRDVHDARARADAMVEETRGDGRGRRDTETMPVVDEPLTAETKRKRR